MKVHDVLPTFIIYVIVKIIYKNCHFVFHCYNNVSVLYYKYSKYSYNSKVKKYQRKDANIVGTILSRHRKHFRCDTCFLSIKTIRVAFITARDVAKLTNAVVKMHSCDTKVRRAL